MFDNVILMIDRYAIWVVFGLAVIKLFHIIFYKGLQPGYIVSTFFTLYSGIHLGDMKNYPQRYRFRQVHNLLTVCFYALLVIWAIVHIILKQV